MKADSFEVGCRWLLWGLSRLGRSIKPLWSWVDWAEAEEEVTLSQPQYPDSPFGVECSLQPWPSPVLKQRTGRDRDTCINLGFSGCSWGKLKLFREVCVHLMLGECGCHIGGRLELKKIFNWMTWGCSSFNSTWPIKTYRWIQKFPCALEGRFGSPERISGLERGDERWGHCCPCFLIRGSGSDLLLQLDMPGQCQERKSIILWTPGIRPDQSPWNRNLWRLGQQADQRPSVLL